MIKSLPNLYSRIGLTKEGIKTTIANKQHLYQEQCQPKIKFGKDQVDKYGDIRFRNLLVPKQNLKEVQQRIHQILQEIRLPANMFGSVANKNNILNAGEHLNHKYFLTIDLKKIFSNITSSQVFKMFLENGFSKDTSNILTALSTLNGSLPQGAPSSPIIANLVALTMINEISAFLRNFKITFTSFVDDLSFSSNKCFRNLASEIIAIIKRNGFFPAYDKIHYRLDYCEITGLIVYGNELKVTAIMRRKAYTNKYLDLYVKRVEAFNQKTKLIAERNSTASSLLFL